VLADPGTLPVVVCRVGAPDWDDQPRHAGAAAPAWDLAVADIDVERLIESVQQSPLAATTLAVHLRTISTVSVEQGLALESAAYGLLQAGPEFATWRAGQPPTTSSGPTGPVVATARDGGSLIITLDRPARHNAISTQLRDELDDALALAEADSSVTSVVLRGNGASFCSGGDLSEFGLRPDVATAHVTRLARSPARRLHRLRSRLTVHIHGATMGGGIELAAFADHIVAHPETTIALPEINLGLIPGAGGTVSITRRIGRHRTAALALTGQTIGADTALRWGLVDTIARTIDL
jgi:Enoyl-CoA hydratase/isomerase